MQSSDFKLTNQAVEWIEDNARFVSGTDFTGAVFKISLSDSNMKYIIGLVDLSLRFELGHLKVKKITKHRFNKLVKRAKELMIRTNFISDIEEPFEEFNQKELHIKDYSKVEIQEASFYSTLNMRCAL